MECESFGGRRLNISEERRALEILDVRLEQVRRELMDEPLCTLAISNVRRGLAQREENFEFANGLPPPSPLAP